MRILLLLLSFSLLASNVLDYKKINDSQKSKNASSFILSMTQIHSFTHSLLKKARKEKDIVKLNCINENFKKIEGLLKTSKDASINLDEAIAKEDKKTINHYYIKIFISNNTVKEAGEAAKNCTGSTIVYSKDKTVKIKIKKIVIEDKKNDLSLNLDTPIPISPYF